MKLEVNSDGSMKLISSTGLAGLSSCRNWVLSQSLQWKHPVEENAETFLCKQ